MKTRTMMQVKRLFEIGGFEADMNVNFHHLFVMLFKDIFFEVLNDYDNGLVSFITANSNSACNANWSSHWVVCWGYSRTRYRISSRKIYAASEVNIFCCFTIRKGQILGCFAMTEFGYCLPNSQS